MGVIWQVRLAPDDDAAAMVTDVDGAWDWLEADDLDWDAIMARADKTEVHVDEPIDLDKSWHGLHFLLTGNAQATGEPLSMLLNDYRKAEPDNPQSPFFLPAEALTAFHEAISALSDEEILDRLDTQAMLDADIYVASVFAQDAALARDYLGENLGILRRVAQLAAEKQLGAVAQLA
ncbi:DUF1877 family protein [Sphingomicrobium marinum]|uniref:DUF1877 family protein n=1 Tax=Sphingomicrobium marinum TaxID=1227950 RepID=UPI00223EC8EF|nr:DUF1877 family protein [Sphingomicrobium marinum]